jgi:hypothetical protein
MFSVICQTLPSKSHIMWRKKPLKSIHIYIVIAFNYYIKPFLKVRPRSGQMAFRNTVGLNTNYVRDQPLTTFLVFTFA